MMNPYPTRMGGRSPRSCDGTPFRRPHLREGLMNRTTPREGLMPDSLTRDGMTPRPNNVSGGCGCGMGRETPHSRGGSQGHSHPCPSSPSPRAEVTPCGCMEGGRDQVSIHCKKLMEQLRAVDFALYETILYLDVYPNSCDALETYRKLKEQHEALRKEYESVCGPLTAFGNESGASWDWMQKPFPWEFDAE